jgi:hypothetical protein
MVRVSSKLDARAYFFAPLLLEGLMAVHPGFAFDLFQDLLLPFGRNHPFDRDGHGLWEVLVVASNVVLDQGQRVDDGAKSVVAAEL